MVRKKRRSKKKSSNKLLKTAILLILFIGLWFIYNHTDIPARIQNALRLHKPTTAQTVPEPEVTPPKPQQGVLPPPEPVVTQPGKTVTCTIRNPQFDNLSYGVPGKADSIVEREGYALGCIEKHEQPAWGQYIMTAEEVSRRAAPHRPVYSGIICSLFPCYPVNSERFSDNKSFIFNYLRIL